MKRHASCTADTQGMNTGMCVELALVPALRELSRLNDADGHCSSDHNVLPQIAIVSDRWRWLGLKTNLATFLATVDAEQLCPEQFVVHCQEDISAELAERVKPTSPWVLKSANGCKGDEVHLVTSAAQAAQIMSDDALLCAELQEELPFGTHSESDDDDPAVNADTGYVLQKHIDCPMVIEGGRKFSLRAYLLLEPAARRVLSYEHDFEVRLADEPFDPERIDDRLQLITNGGASGRSW